MGFPGDLQCDITHWKIVKESIRGDVKIHRSLPLLAAVGCHDAAAFSIIRAYDNIFIN